MTTWRRYLFDGFTTHVVPAELEVPLALEMTSRGAKMRELPPGYSPTNPSTIIEWSFDIGGPAHVNRPTETVEWCGLRLWIPSSDVEVVAQQLARLPVRWFDSGIEYRKLTLWMHSTVMTPVQAEELHAALTALAPRAVERARDASLN